MCIDQMNHYLPPVEHSARGSIPLDPCRFIYFFCYRLSSKRQRQFRLSEDHWKEDGQQPNI